MHCDLDVSPRRGRVERAGETDVPLPTKPPCAPSIARYVEARESRDPAAIGALFTDDADQFNSAGEWRRGRDAIVKGTLQSSQRNSGARSITVKAIRFPAPGVAIADGEYGIGAQRLWTTLVLTRQGDAWRIAAIRNSHAASRPDAETRVDADYVTPT